VYAAAAGLLQSLERQGFDALDLRGEHLDVPFDEIHILISRRFLDDARCVHDTMSRENGSRAPDRVCAATKRVWVRGVEGRAQGPELFLAVQYQARQHGLNFLSAARQKPGSVTQVDDVAVIDRAFECRASRRLIGSLFIGSR